MSATPRPATPRPAHRPFCVCGHRWGGHERVFGVRTRLGTLIAGYCLARGCLCDNFVLRPPTDWPVIFE